MPDCEREDCDEPGIFRVVTQDTRGLGAEDYRVCAEHLPELAAMILDDPGLFVVGLPKLQVMAPAEYDARFHLLAEGAKSYRGDGQAFGPIRDYRRK